MKKTLFAVLLNLLYWFPKLFVLYPFFAGYYKSSPIFFNNLVSMLVTGVVFYWFYLFVFPRFFSKQKISFFIIYGLCFICIASGVGVYVFKPMQSYSLHMAFISLFIGSVSSAFIGCSVKAFLNWYADIVYKKQLEKKNTEMELALLKARINPHFLFNTLNNIDVLIEKDAITASVYLKKLSDILRFTLYEGPLAKTELAQEVNYIQQYIELQKIRTANPDFVNFEVRGDMDKLFIAPMLFIPYIENAFKHATNKKIPNAIEIDINVEGNAVQFTCSNAFNQADKLAQPYGGLGLDLINSRLKLLYKDRKSVV